MTKVARPARDPAFDAAEVALSAWPIVRREFVGLLRTRKAFWIAVLTVGAASFFPLLSWPEPGSPMAAETAREAFGDYVRALAAAFFICTPAVAAVSITTERERNTYDILYGTRIPPSGIILGKLIASTGFFVILFALTFPMAAILYLLGGFSAGDFALLAGAGIVAIVLIGIVGLWNSVRSRTSISALVRAYLSLIGVCLLSGVIAAFLTEGAMPHAGWPFYFVFLLGTLTICIGLLSSTLRRARVPSLFPRPPDWQDIATARLRRTPVPPPRSWLARLVLRPARKGIPDGWNPVLAATAMSIGRGSLRSHQITVIIVYFIGVLVPILGSLVRVDLFFSLAEKLCLLAVVLIVPAASSVSLSSERELGILDFLRSTPLSPRQILTGKLVAALVRAGGPLVPCWLFHVVLLVLPIGEPSGIGVAAAFIAAGTATALLAATCGLAGAVLSRTALTGTLLGYLLLAACFRAIPSMTETFPFTTSLVVTLSLSAILFAATTWIFRRRWMRER